MTNIDSGKKIVESIMHCTVGLIQLQEDASEILSDAGQNELRKKDRGIDGILLSYCLR